MGFSVSHKSLNLIVLLGNSTYPAPTAADVMKELRDKGYHAPAVPGVDLMRIDIGDTVTVTQPAQKN